MPPPASSFDFAESPPLWRARAAASDARHSDFGLPRSREHLLARRAESER